MGDLIDLLLQSPDFNSVYALPGNQENDINDIDDKKEESVEIKEDVDFNKNKLLKVGSQCLVYAQSRWFDGAIHKKIENEDTESNKEYFEILYVSESIIDGVSNQCKITMSRYDENLKYNEPIPFNEKHDIWEIGSKCLYYSEDSQIWCPGHIISITVDDES